MESALQRKQLLFVRHLSKTGELDKMKFNTNYAYALAILMLMLFTVACGNITGASASFSGEATFPPTAKPSTVLAGSIEEGRAIFNGEKKIPGFVPCSTCHYVKPHRYPRLGPDLAGLGKRAGTRVPGLSAEEYIYESIRLPDEYVVEGFPASTMNQAYDDRLSDEEIDDIVAYLLSL